jgi:hypothetical protein
VSSHQSAKRPEISGFSSRHRTSSSVVSHPCGTQPIVVRAGHFGNPLEAAGGPSGLNHWPTGTCWAAEAKVAREEAAETARKERRGNESSDGTLGLYHHDFGAPTNGFHWCITVYCRVHAHFSSDISARAMWRKNFAGHLTGLSAVKAEQHGLVTG